jgi:hypothetical protein
MLHESVDVPPMPSVRAGHPFARRDGKPGELQRSLIIDPHRLI